MKSCRIYKLMIINIIIVTIMSFGLAEAQELEYYKKSAIKIEAEGDWFATFTNSQHPGNRIGYRFFEHIPLEFGTIPKTVEEAGINVIAQEQIIKEFTRRKNVFIHKIITKETKYKEDWVDQSWTNYLIPVQDGIEVLFVVETEGKGLPYYYGIQQCFRMSGKTNREWRRKIAETPAFSEYDLWDSQKDKRKTSLSFIMRNGNWEKLPAMESCVGVRTPSGVIIDKERFHGDLANPIGPYEGIPQKPVDSGLATRTDLNGNWVSGLFWENTSHITNHHPADCLHAIVNIGNIPPYSKRVLKGKIYWFKGTKDDLFEKWQNDFNQSSTEKKFIQ